MCLLIAKPASIQIPESHLREGFEGNSHGAGFAFVKDGNIHMSKGFFRFESFLNAYRKIEQYSAIVHFRLATHGSRDESNCHPFAVGPRLAVAHNGIINIKTEGNESDTAAYVRTVLRPSLANNPDITRNKDVIDQMVAQIGHSKLAFLHADGTHTIVNESMGHWNGGVWYSNDSYKGFNFSRWSMDYEPNWRDNDPVWDGQEQPTEEADEFLASFNASRMYCRDCGRHITGEFSMNMDLELICEDCIEMSKLCGRNWHL